ncbi:MAG: hypothetical protein KDK39_06135 [Leptospiraceae bacterium]|nr:hypothetical protein [Leptospiraceae bacterium]
MGIQVRLLNDICKLSLNSSSPEFEIRTAWECNKKRTSNSGIHMDIAENLEARIPLEFFQEPGNKKNLKLRIILGAVQNGESNWNVESSDWIELGH